MFLSLQQILLLYNIFSLIEGDLDNLPKNVMDIPIYFN